MRQRVQRLRAAPVTAGTFVLAEGPVWDDAAGELVWVDIPRGTVQRGVLEGAERLSDRLLVRVPSTVGAALPAADGSLLLAAGTRFLGLRPDGSLTGGPALSPGESAGRRFNDAKADPWGRVLAGTMALDSTPGAGTLYRLDAGSAIVPLVRGATVSNGLGWSLDGATLYYADSGRGSVDAFAYDAATGGVADRRTVVSIPPGDGVPDGLSVDSMGRLWVAIWGAGQVRCFTATGAQVACVDVDAPHTTSCTFAGPDLDVLVITTAREGLDEAALRRHPRSGALFAARVDVPGLPPARYGGTPAQWPPA